MVDKMTSQGKIAPASSNIAEVAEQADALRSGRSGLYAHVGSTPTFGTQKDPVPPRERVLFGEGWQTSCRGGWLQGRSLCVKIELWI
jgi:hypothetical protein